MNTYGKHIVSAALLGAFILLALGSGMVKKQVTIQENMIPADFKEFSGTLLILNSETAWNNGIKRQFDANYKGKYAMVDADALDGSYPDTEEYRYVLGPDQYTGSSGLKIYIKDRLKNKKYYSEFTVSWNRLVKNYSIALENKRKK